jgi:sugar phosphate isomerase/epimerase
MREPIWKYFDVGILSFMIFPTTGTGDDLQTLAYINRIACDDYFNAIEVARINSLSVRVQAANMLQTAHMRIGFGAHPKLLSEGLNPNNLNEAERKKAEAALIESIDQANELGAGNMAFLSGTWEDETKEQSYAQLLKTTQTLCNYAAEKNIMVELEVFDYDIAKKSLIGPAPLAARFAADIRTTHNNFGLLIDLSHIPLTHETPEFVVRTLRPYLTHFHIGNTVCKNPSLTGYGDEHQRFGFPGSENDVYEVLNFLRVLKQEGFFCSERPYMLSFEIKPWQSEYPDLVIANAKRVLNRAWALLED